MFLAYFPLAEFFVYICDNILHENLFIIYITVKHHHNLAIDSSTKKKTGRLFFEKSAFLRFRFGIFLDNCLIETVFKKIPKRNLKKALFSKKRRPVFFLVELSIASVFYFFVSFTLTVFFRLSRIL